MKIQGLQNGQIVRARCGRAGAHNVRWEPWREAKLFIAAMVLSRKNPVPKVLLIALQDDGAEYLPDDFCPIDRVFHVEDYYLEIEGLEA